MASSKLFVDKHILDYIKERSETNIRTLDMEHPCIQDIAESSSGTKVAIYFLSSDSKYYQVQMYWLENLKMWDVNSITNSTTAPNKCLNISQSSPTFTTNANCMDVYTLTTDVYYHPNFDSILVIFFIIVLIFIYFPYRIISRAFGRWLKV